MKIATTEKIDAINIGLILLSGLLAMIIPFELFLLSYAILGPLHYLTEISWLHDKQYFTKHKYDSVYLVILGLAITFLILQTFYRWDIIDLPDTIPSNLAWIAMLLAVLFVTAKSTIARLVGTLIILITVQISNKHSVIILTTILLPTLFHVYVFTGLFMLYGALKSKSRMGIASVLVFIATPLMLIFLFPDKPFFQATKYSQMAYTGNGSDIGFQFLHIDLMRRFLDYNVVANSAEQAKTLFMQAIFNSQAGIIIGRLIGFAYTYHYLNWFSKTRVIQWHKVPKARFVLVAVVWIASIALYAIDYTMGIVWLFLLSYLHVVLELPLNVTSIIGIFKSLRLRLQPEAVHVKPK
jgi:hypothetical protein